MTQKKATAQLAKATKYEQLRTKSQEQLSAEQLQWDLEDNKDQLEADLKATKRSLTTAERELEELKSERLLDSGKILKKQDEIRGIKAGLDALEELIKEMF